MTFKGPRFRKNSFHGKFCIPFIIPKNPKIPSLVYFFYIKGCLHDTPHNITHLNVTLNFWDYHWRMRLNSAKAVWWYNTVERERVIITWLDYKRPNEKATKISPDWVYQVSCYFTTPLFGHSSQMGSKIGWMECKGR